MGLPDPTRSSLPAARYRSTRKPLYLVFLSVRKLRCRNENARITATLTPDEMTQNNYEKLREVRILDAGCTTGTLERAGGILLRRAVSLSLMYWYLVASEAAASGKTLVCLRPRPKMLRGAASLSKTHEPTLSICPN